MQITVIIQEEEQVVQVDRVSEGDLQDVAAAVSDAITCAFSYAVECTLSTSHASFDRDGIVG